MEKLFNICASLTDFLLNFRYRSRSRSPIYSSRDYDRDRARYHYDDPRREAREEELIRQRIRDEDRRRQIEPSSYHLTNSEAMANTSPFAGTKVNLKKFIHQLNLTADSTRFEYRKFSIRRRPCIILDPNFPRLI